MPDFFMNIRFEYEPDTDSPSSALRYAVSISAGECRVFATNPA